MLTTDRFGFLLLSWWIITKGLCLSMDCSNPKQYYNIRVDDCIDCPKSEDGCTSITSKNNCLACFEVPTTRSTEHALNEVATTTATSITQATLTKNKNSAIENVHHGNNQQFTIILGSFVVLIVSLVLVSGIVMWYKSMRRQQNDNNRDPENLALRALPIQETDENGTEN